MSTKDTIDAILVGFFVAEATIAFALHLRWFQERRRIRNARKASGQNGTLGVLADVFVHVEAFRLTMNLLLVCIAVGLVLFGGYAFYLLLLLPMASIGSSLVWIRSLDL